MSESTNQSTPAPSAPAAAPAATEKAVNTGIEASSSEDTSSEEGSEGIAVEAVDVAEAKDAAKDIKAKEVKGSDGERYKIKVDGQELDLSKEEVVRYAQMGKAGQRAMQEKAELQKRTVTFIEALKKDPRSVLSDPAIGVDVIKFAQEVLAQQLEEEALSPEQKKLKEVEAELEKFRKQTKEDEDNRKKSDFEREVQKYEEELQVQVQDALEAEKLPRKPAILSKMAEILITAHDHKLKITPRQAAKLAKEELTSDVKELFGVLSDDDLESMLGSDLFTRIRKASLKRVKPVVPSIKTQATTEGMTKVESKPKSKINMKEFMKLSYSDRKKMGQ